MFRKMGIFFEMIKFEHTVFALPFAYLGYVLGSKGALSWPSIGWITLAMVAGRTAGMCLNRIVDREIDARNPRTCSRAIVRGEILPSFSWAVTLLCFVLLVLSASRLNPLCLAMSPLAIVLLISYHYLKRFTFLCHFGIGLVLACAPIGGWIAATGQWETEAVILGLAVLFWVAGFDIFYSLQDLEFDRREGLHSLAVRFGTPAAIRISRLSHVLTLLFLVQLGIMMSAGFAYWLGLGIASIILAAEHLVIREGQLQFIGIAFFVLNGILSSCFFVFASAAVFFKGG